jgi:hypothetical protein
MGDYCLTTAYHSEFGQIIEAGPPTLLPVFGPTASWHSELTSLNDGRPWVGSTGWCRCSSPDLLITESTSTGSENTPPIESPPEMDYCYFQS